MPGQNEMLASILVICTIATAQKTNGEQCDCFKTNGSTEAYFAYHRFFDYRNISPKLTSHPPVLTNATETQDAGNSSSFFSDESWAADWTIPNWDNSDSLNTPGSDATVLMINSPNNVYIESSKDNSPVYNTYLTLRTARTENFQSAGEIDSTALNYHYLSARFFARIVGNTGGCAGLFTYLCGADSCSTSSSSVQEADIEILTSGPQNKIQLTNQPSESSSGDTLSQATLNATLPDGIKWTAWNEYRYDWLPGLSSWYVNGASVGSISFQAPKDPAGIILNMWSNGGSWTGNMSVDGASYLQIQWIEIVYNTSGPAAGSTNIVSDELNLLERSSILATSRVGDQVDHVRDLSSALDIPHNYGLVAPRAGYSNCHTVCSVDTNVIVTGTPVVLSIASRENVQQAMLRMILLLLIGVWLLG